MVEATEDARGQQVVLEQRVAGADWLRVTYRLPPRPRPPGDHQPPQQAEHLGQGERLLRLPVRRRRPRGAAGVGRRSHRVGAGVGAGWAEYMRAIRHFVSLGDGDRAIGWATAEAPLVEVGTIGLPYVPFPSTLPVIEPATVYSWVHNNIWDTNFPVEQAFETTFRYRVAAGTGTLPAWRHGRRPRWCNRCGRCCRRPRARGHQPRRPCSGPRILGSSWWVCSTSRTTGCSSGYAPTPRTGSPPRSGCRATSSPARP